MWNDSAHRGIVASAATIHEREAANGDAAAAEAAQATAESACEVKVPPRPRSSKGEPVAAAGAAPYRGACLRLDSLLQHTGQLVHCAAKFASYSTDLRSSHRMRFIIVAL